MKSNWLNLAAALMALTMSNANGASHQDIVATTLILEAGGEYSKGAMEAVHEVI